MAVVYLLIWFFASPSTVPIDLLFTSLLLFVLADLVVSMPRREEPIRDEKSASFETKDEASSEEAAVELASVDSSAILEALKGSLSVSQREFLRLHLPESDEGIDSLLILDDRPEDADQEGGAGDTGLRRICTFREQPDHGTAWPAIMPVHLSKSTATWPFTRTNGIPIGYCRGSSYVAVSMTRSGSNTTKSAK